MTASLKSALLFALIVTLTLLAACQRPVVPGGPVGMPNPASAYCDRLGYRLEMREDPNGQYGVCIFPDGTECEEWSLFRGECGLDKTYCARQGYTPEVRDNVLTCVFPDGSSCPEWDYLNGDCGPGTQ